MDCTHGWPLTPSLTETLYSGLISFECSERRRFLSLFLFISSVSSGRCRTSGSGLLLPSLLTYLLAAGGCRLAQIRAPQVKREMGSPPVTLSFIRPSLLAGASIITACWDDACWSKPLTDWWSKHRLPGHCLHREARVPDVRAGLPRGIVAWRATREHRLDGRPGLETVDAAEGVENACWCIYAVNYSVCSFVEPLVWA